MVRLWKRVDVFELFEHFGVIGKVVKALELELFQELVRRAVEEGSADGFLSADDMDEPGFQKPRDGVLTASRRAVVGRAAHLLELRPGDGLLIGDGGEHFEKGLAELSLAQRGEDLRQHLAVAGIGTELHLAVELRKDDAARAGILLFEFRDDALQLFGGESASTAFLIFSILVLLEIQRSVLRALHREQPDVAEYLILFGVQSAVLHQFQHGEEGGDYVAVVEVRLEE